MARLNYCIALRSVGRRKGCIEVIEHLFRRWRRRVDVRLRSRLYARVAFFKQFLLLRLIPCTLRAQVVSQAQYRFAFPRLGNIFRRPVT